MAHQANIKLEGGSIEFVSSQLGSRIVQGELDLPMLPRVAGAVIAMTQDENANMAGLAHLIQQDQALASRVMKIANSPIYRGPSPMNSLQQAIARMGMKSVSEMALAASVGSKVFSVTGYEQDVTFLWQHSVASAGWSKEIARIKRRNVESSFMCGLLHQIGKPVTLQVVVEICETHAIALLPEAVLQLIQQFHVPVGLVLGKAWELPSMVVESIEFYQDYDAAKQFDREAMITSGAHFLASLMLEAGDVDAASVLDSEVFEHLNFYDNDVEFLLDKVEGVRNMVEVMSI